jgi:hypothetical protein
VTCSKDMVSHMRKGGTREERLEDDAKSRENVGTQRVSVKKGYGEGR